MIKDIVVVCSGTMGKGIAYAAAISSSHVNLHDVFEEALIKQNNI